MNTFLYPILASITAVGIYFFYITPLWDETKLLNVERAQFAQSLQDVDAIADLLSNLKISYESISVEDLARLDRILPRTFDKTRIAKDMSDILANHNTTLHELNVDAMHVSRRTANEEETPLQTHAVSISFDATYAVFKDIVADLEKHLQLATINEITFGNTLLKESGSPDQTQYTIDLLFYSYDFEQE